MSVSCRPVVYVATPVRAACATVRRWNWLRAVTLARLAAHEGLAPLLPALTVGGALEGFPHAGGHDHPAAMACCLGLLRAVKQAGGGLWVLTRDDDTLSEGCAAELRAWNGWLSLEGGTRQQTPALVRWRDLEERAWEAGLLDAWSALRDPPSVVGILAAGSFLTLHGA